MSAQSILSPYPFFTDRSGVPLNGGKIYVGTAGANPITNPVSLWFDADLSVPAAQPVRTSGGYPLNNGSPARLFVDADEYSIVVQTSAGVTVYSNLNSTLLATPVAVGIPQTAAELAAGVTPVRLVTAEGEVLKPGDVRRYCTAAETNHQQAFEDAHAANEVIYVPAGTWNVDNFVMDIDGRTLQTAGFATVITQRLGNTNFSTIQISASNITVGPAISFVGNIATDTGEQQHGIRVGVNSADIINVSIGDILAEDMRGDALYIGSAGGFQTTNVTFGVVTGRNIYRNVVSIVGATQVVGVGVYCDGSAGYSVFDIEPNALGDASTDIYIGWVRGGIVQIAPPTAATAASRIRVGFADLNPAYQANSSPGYSEGGSNYANQIRNAVVLRNCTGVIFDYLKIRDHSHFGLTYIFNPGEVRGRGIRIGYLDASGVGASESSVNALINSGQIESLTIDDGEVTLQSPTTDYVLVGDPATKNNQFIVNRLKINGTLVRYCSKSVFSQIIANHTNDVQLIRDCDDSVLMSSDITAPRFITNTTGFSAISCKVTCTGAYIAGTSNNLSFQNCSGGIATDSILQGSATYDPPNLADGDGTTTTVTVTGAALGDVITGYSFSLDLQDVTLTAYIQAANTVEFRFQNESGGAKDLGSGTLRVYVKKA